MRTTDPSWASRTMRGAWSAPAVVFAVGAIVSASWSWNVSLWTDEAVTISAATRTLPQLWELLQGIDAVHGLYYALMTGWVAVFGQSEFWLRLPSALAAGATAAGVVVLTRRLATPGTAAVAGFVCALLPRMTWAGIEARPFVFSALLAVWATWAYVRATQRPGWASWTLYGVLALLGVLTNIYIVFVVISHAMTTLMRREPRRTVVGFFVAAAVTAVAVAPFLLLVRSQQAQLGGNGDRQPLSILRKILVNQLFLGETPSPDALPALATLAWQGGAVALAVVGAILIAIGLWRVPRRGDDRRTLVSVALPWLALPTILVAAYAVAVSPLYQPRYLTFTAPAAAILIALGLRALRRRAVVAVAIAISLLPTLVVFGSQRVPFAKSGSDWSAAAEIVQTLAEPGQSVYFVPRYESDGTPITLTARRIADSYPGAFVGLRDLTLEATGAATASIDGFSAPLSEREPQIGDKNMWVLYGTHYPESVIEESQRILTDLGFTGTIRWAGPSSVVVEYQYATP